MDNLSTALTALLPVLGVVIGASLQFFFSRFGERRKQLEILRSQAYVDYLRSVAQIAQIDRADHKKRVEFLAAAADAKTRICVYGSAKVVDALAAFEKGGPALDSSDSLARFLVMCNEMRQQSFGTSEFVQAENLAMVLFGPDVDGSGQRSAKSLGSGTA